MNEYQQNSITISSLQNYITELTVYINENNAKYTKNLETLKIFYEQQISALSQKTTLQEEDRLQLRNELLTVKDVLNNRQKQISDLKNKNQEFKNENQQTRQKLYEERRKIDELYQEMQRIKKQFKGDLDNQEKQIKDSQNQNNSLILKLKGKQQEINALNKQNFRLEDQLSQRYSLPQKLKDVQLQSVRNKTVVQALAQSKKQIESKLDYQTNELQRLRKQNKRLEINHDTRQANAKNQLNEAVQKQKDVSQQKLKRLQSLTQQQVFQINQLQNALKVIKRQNSQLQKKLHQYVEQTKILKHKIQNHDSQKDRYIEEFQKLKHEYEEVIQNLEDAIPQYQKKNWDLQQDNRDLNVQLDGLRDLLNQIKAMNSLQPLKHEYRQIAELQLLAQNDYKAYKKEEKNAKNQSIKFNQTHEHPSSQKDQNQLKWDKLLMDIENIQVS